ncbi:hypothetical protein CRUP_007365, partial [Coryphaenoides rupestris]
GAGRQERGVTTLDVLQRPPGSGESCSVSQARPVLLHAVLWATFDLRQPQLQQAVPRAVFTIITVTVVMTVTVMFTHSRVIIPLMTRGFYGRTRRTLVPVLLDHLENPSSSVTEETRKAESLAHFWMQGMWKREKHPPQLHTWGPETRRKRRGEDLSLLPVLRLSGFVFLIIGGGGGAVVALDQSLSGSLLCGVVSWCVTDMRRAGRAPGPTGDVVRREEGTHGCWTGSVRGAIFFSSRVTRCFSLLCPASCSASSLA